jgi:hypothetical protein
MGNIYALTEIARIFLYPTIPEQTKRYQTARGIIIWGLIKLTRSAEALAGKTYYVRRSPIPFGTALATGGGGKLRIF